MEDIYRVHADWGQYQGSSLYRRPAEVARAVQEARSFGPVVVTVSVIAPAAYPEPRAVFVYRFV